MGDNCKNHLAKSIQARRQAGRQVGDNCKIIWPRVSKQGNKQGDKCKDIRPSVSRVGKGDRAKIIRPRHCSPSKGAHTCTCLGNFKKTMKNRTKKGSKHKFCRTVVERSNTREGKGKHPTHPCDPFECPSNLAQC